jgi:hypothetical protein
MPGNQRHADASISGADAMWERSITWYGAVQVLEFRIDWLPFLKTYRTVCLAPQPDFRRVLEDVLAMQLAA